MKNILLLICFMAYLLQGRAQTLYALTLDGGKRRENVTDNGAGTIIKFTPGSNSLTVARPFETDEAANPGYSDFIQASNGKLYGTAMDGWNSNYGAIVSYDPSTSTYTRLKNFDNTNGAYPAGGLVQASDGKLYGMTYGGGSLGYGNVHYGVIYSYNPASSVYTSSWILMVSMEVSLPVT